MEIKKRIKLSKKDRLSLIRGIMLTKPDIKTYGYNRKIITFFKTEFDINVSDSSVSKYIKAIKEQFQESKSIVMTKTQIINHYINLFEDSKNEFAKMKCLKAIGKLEGHEVNLFEDLSEKTPVHIYIPDNKRNLKKKPPKKTPKKIKKVGDPPENVPKSSS